MLGTECVREDRRRCKKLMNIITTFSEKVYRLDPFEKKRSILILVLIHVWRNESQMEPL
jgi:hypothetical protein